MGTIMSFRNCVAAVAIGIASLACPAGATTISLTWQGNFATGSDYANSFGAGNDLAGVAFKVVQTFDDTKTSISTSPNTNSLSGLGPDWGSGFNYSPGSAVVTINGVSQSIAGDYGSGYDKTDLGNAQFVNSSTSDFKNTTEKYIYNVVIFSVNGQNIFDSLDLHEGFSTSDISADSGGFMSFANFDYLTNNYLQSVTATFNFDTLSLLVASGDGGSGGGDGGFTSAAPEPAAWAMMIFGFGMAGGAMRRRAGRSAIARQVEA